MGEQQKQKKRRNRRWIGPIFVAVAVGWGALAAAAEPLHLIYTADVRGTVGICG